jgi:hypothetical protein
VGLALRVVYRPEVVRCRWLDAAQQIAHNWSARGKENTAKGLRGAEAGTAVGS